MRATKPITKPVLIRRTDATDAYGFSQPQLKRWCNEGLHAARLGQAGALALAEIAESVGHASTQMTLDRYVHTEPDVDKRNAGAGMWATGPTNVIRLRPPLTGEARPDVNPQSSATLSCA